MTTALSSGRYSARAGVRALESGRYQAPQRLEVRRRSRYSTSLGVVLSAGRYAATQKAAALSAGSYTCEGPELEPSPPGPPGPNNPGFGPSAARDAWQTGFGELEILELSANGRDLRDTVPVVELELNESGAHSWSLTIPDGHHYHPERAGGEWEGVLTDNHEHLFRLRLVWGGVHRLDFVGIPTSTASHRVTKDGQRTWDLTWSGVCLSWKLFMDSVTQRTLRSTRRGTVRQDRVIREAAQAAGVTVSGLPTLPLLRLQHRQNFRPGDMIQQYCERWGLGWRFDGEIMHFFRRTLGSPAWRYGAQTLVESESSTLSNAELYSRVVVSRLVETGGNATNPVTSTTYGDHYSETLPEVWNGVQIHFEGTPFQGVFSDFVARDANGNIISVVYTRPDSPRLYAAHLYGRPLIGVKTISWTFGNPQPGSTFTEGYGQVFFSGTPADPQDEGFPAEFERSFSEPVVDPKLVAIVGIKTRESPIDETVATVADAKIVGERHLERLRLNRNPKQLSAPFNPGMKPGQTLGLSDPQLGTNKRGLVRRVRHRISPDLRDLATTIEASGWE